MKSRWAKSATLRLALCVAMLSACQAKKAGNNAVNAKAGAAAGSVSSGATTNTDASTATSTSTDTTPPGDPVTIAAVTTSVGIRNFDQINAAMAALTEIRGNATITKRFVSLQARLPNSNEIKSFSFSAQGAITELAAEYCTALINNNTYTTQRTAAIGMINLGAAPSVALITAGKVDVANNLISKFWGSSAITLPANATSQTNIVNLITAVVAGETDNATTTKNAVIAACTTVLASSPVSTL